jgi:hypothetical protein
LISQDVNIDYDTFDSAVVAAESEEQARKIHPTGYNYWSLETWCNPEDVTVKLIGKAVETIELGVICASFNAG